MPILNQIGGWKPWYYPPTLREGYRTANSPLPLSYFPASAFTANIISDHCLLAPPWAFQGERSLDTFTTTGGPTSFVGAVAGLAAVGQRLGEETTVTWGIGHSGGIPSVGFCIGDSYKENAFFRYTVINLGVENLIESSAYIDVFQRSRLKRIYVAEGMVVRYVANTTSGDEPEYILTLDVEGTVPSGITLTGGEVKITKKNGITFNITIKELLPNWELIVYPPGTNNVPESGDFYELTEPWCIEDPYLISGFWLGAQGESGESDSSTPKCKYQVYKTTDVVPYDEVKFTGSYVYTKKNGEVVATTAGTPFSETPENEWKWVYNGEKSFIYGTSSDRYISTSNVTVDDSVTVDTDQYVSLRLKKYTKGSDNDVSSWKNLDGITFIRMELDKGGNSARQNWHSPILTKCWLQQNEKFFAIVGQPESNIIDVSLKDITGTTNLDIDGGTVSTIFNQYAWMINEHYYQRGDAKGFLSGEVGSASYNENSDISTLTIISDGTSYGTVVQNTNFDDPNLKPNSYYNRFISTFNGGSGSGIQFKKMWNKFDRWYVFDDSYRAFPIIPDSLSITTDQPVDEMTADTKSTVSVKVKGDLSETQFAGLYFDEPYKRLGPQLIPIFTYEFQQALVDSLPTICVDTNYRSAAISISIESNEVVGITGGTWWGLGAQGLDNVLSADYCPLFITVPLADRGVSSFFNNLIYQDWVFYNDVDTNIVTLRCGSLNFTDKIRRSEISIGSPNSTGIFSEFPITFDTEQDRVKKISMKLSSGREDDEFGISALTFQIDNTQDYFGFKSTGSGVFDFQALRINGHAAGTVDFNKYQNQGNFISPVYIYNKNPSNLRTPFYDVEILELGIDTTNKLYCKNGSPTDIKIEYIKNFQLLKNVKFFDVHLIEDGECITLYSMEVFDKFSISGKNADPSEWSTSQCLFALGSADDAYNWGTPTVHNLKYKNNDNYQYPIMLINGCDYLTSFYNPTGSYFGIVLRCYYDDNEDITPFIGILYVNKGSFTDELVSAEVESDKKFWFRKLRCSPGRTKNYIGSNNESYIKIEDVLTDGPVEESPYDQFIRVMGIEKTRSVITSSLVNVGLMYSTVLSDGTSVILYGSGEGIRLLAASNWVNWDRSKIILSRNGDSPLFIKDNLFYITPEGIVVKRNVSHLINEACLCTDNAGIDEENIERIQEQFDDIEPVLIGSGKIANQRISGHTTHDGTYKVFYYNINNILCCIEDIDSQSWHMVNNF